jgi:hypothetical protein
VFVEKKEKKDVIGEGCLTTYAASRRARYQHRDIFHHSTVIHIKLEEKMLSGWFAHYSMKGGLAKVVLW